jgi:peptidoglycan hydrolase-like protein with peptidoglycan-binding domain
MTLFRVAALAGLLAAAAPLHAARAQQSALLYSVPLSQDAARQVQSKLNAMHAYQGPIDGNWGPESDSALRGFQQTRGLQVTGAMNPATATMLGLDETALFGPPPQQPPADATGAPAQPGSAQPGTPQQAAPAPGTPAQGTGAAGATQLPPGSFVLGSQSISLIQSRLHDLGFYSGGIDGVWGAGSLNGVKAFQSAHGMTADGRLTPNTLRAMGVDPSQMRP